MHRMWQSFVRSMAVHRLHARIPPLQIGSATIKANTNIVRNAFDRFTFNRTPQHSQFSRYSSPQTEGANQ